VRQSETEKKQRSAVRPARLSARPFALILAGGAILAFALGAWPVGAFSAFLCLWYLARARPAVAKRIDGPFLALTSLVVGLFLCEALVRVTGWAPSVHPVRPWVQHSAYRASPNPLLGYVLKANYRDDDDPDLHESFATTNAHGQRDVERTHAKAEGVFRILLLGDSVVAGHGIRDLDDTISRRMEREFERAGRRVEVLNFGVGGYCTRGEIELLRVKGLLYAPDMVVVLFVFNDYEKYNSQVGHYDPSPGGAAPPRWARRLFVRSAFFRLCALRFDLFSMGAHPAALRRRQQRAVGSNPVDRGFALLAEMAETHGFRPLVAIWPTFTTMVGDLRHPPGERPGELLVESLARKHGLRCVRLSPFFARDFEDFARGQPGGRTSAQPRGYYTIGDRVHPNQRGAAVAGRALAEIIAAPGAGGTEKEVIQPSAISNQPSAFSNEPSAFSHQRSAMRHQRSAISVQQ